MIVETLLLSNVKFARKDGTQRQGPIVKDSQNNNWDGKLIANGSTVNVKACTF